jgi:hypothetical protein
MIPALEQFRPIPLLRNSERAAFKTCQAQWSWAWNMGLVPAMPKQDARWFGSAWHVVWAEYYTPPMNNGVRASGFTRGREPHETWDEQMKYAHVKLCTTEWGAPDWEQEWVDAKALGHAMIDGQLAKWKGDPAWEVIYPEHRFRSKIPFNDRQSKMPMSHWISLGYVRGANGAICEIVGTFDLTIRDHSDGHFKVVDWKSAAAYDAVSAWLTKDDQVGTYLAISTAFLRRAELIKPNQEVTGGIWSFARKQMPPDPATLDSDGRKRNKPQKKHFIEAVTGKPGVALTGKETLVSLEIIAKRLGLTVLGDVSKQQPQELFWREEVMRNRANRFRQISRIADDAEQIAVARGGLLGITKSPGKHCNWCDYKELCDVDENGGDTEQYIKDVFRVEDKYSDHQPGAKNSKVSSGR